MRNRNCTKIFEIIQEIGVFYSYLLDYGSCRVNS